MMINKIDNFEEYLDELANIEDCLIIFSVRDTAGAWFDDNVQKKFQNLGLKENLVQALMVGYVAVIDKGQVAFEEKNSITGIVKYERETEHWHLYVCSKAFVAGNEAVIKINGKNYAVNDRGINIVVYDYKNNQLIDAVSFDTHTKKCYCTRVNEHYDIGVVGCWWGANYGSLLNGYAVYKALTSLGLSVWMIYRHDLGARRDTIHGDFIRRFYPTYAISPMYPIEKLGELNEKCDMFLAGSDQIWKYFLNRISDMEFMLKFADDSKKKISFASSFGHAWDSTPKELLPETTRLLRRFDAISVREDSGVEICEKVYGLRAKKVIEPVFCLTLEEYEEIAAKSSLKVDEPYILSYILDPTPEKREAILYYSQITGKKCINILDLDAAVYKTNKEKLNLPNTMGLIGPDDFVKLYMNAEFVITDSFHGTCFSIIFRKAFLSIMNPNRGAVRFDELLKKYALTDRLARDPQRIMHEKRFLEEIDYAEIEMMIQQDKEESLGWLKNAIVTPREKMPSIKLGVPEEVKLLYKNTEFVKIRILATLLRDYGIKHVVLSPGGRDVPLVRMFEYHEETFVLHRVTDERSAAYFGLGIAAQLQEPVACVCTSGTAASNYLPAVTEAFFTGVPLILITADRQQIYLYHGEDQTIPQKHIYDGVIKKSITLPEAAGYQAEYQTRRDISDCILESTHNGFGPVHINMAISDIMLGSKIGKEYWSLLPEIHPHILRVGAGDSKSELMKWVGTLIRSQRILIVYGQNFAPTQEQLSDIENFAVKYNCVIVTDFISNLDCAYSLKPYNMLRMMSQNEFNSELTPDILITVGGKRLMNDPLTFKIRHGLNHIRHWSVTSDGKIKDFYFRLTSVLEMSQDFFFRFFAENAGDIRNNGLYYGKWKTRADKTLIPEVKTFNTHYVQSKFIPQIPENALLHLGVGQSFYDCRRYTMNKNVEVFCNMGTNGIDGCTSTFMGQCAVARDKLCFLLVGDLSFFYDMNSIWNKNPGKNVRIMMVNNNGTGLLANHQLKAISSVHNTSAKGWVESTGFQYISARSLNEFEAILPYFLSEQTENALFFEVFCD